MKHALAALLAAAAILHAGDLSVAHFSGTGQAPAQTAKPYLRVTNTSASTIALSGHAVSWDIGDDGIAATSIAPECWWVSAGSCADVSFTVVPLDLETSGTKKRNIRITIALPATSLRAGSALEIQWGYHDKSWQHSFVETDDWSFTAANGLWNVAGDAGVDLGLAPAAPAMAWRGQSASLPEAGAANIGDVARVNGSAWVLTREGWVLLSEGSVGPQGAIGPMGPQGPVGDIGPQGIVGPQGPKGDVGPAGPQGMAGAVGPQGPEGSVGATGPAGPQGAKGDIGPEGPQGLVGPIGPQGVAGPIGATGAVGPQGPKGDVGPAGPAGPQGPTADLSTVQNAIAALQLDNATLKAQVAALQNLLQNFSRVNDTVFITHANLKIRNGLGGMNSTNGLGNLVVGYSDDPSAVALSTGSHNIVVGGSNRFSSWGSIVSGLHNNVSGAYSSAIASERTMINAAHGVSISGQSGNVNGLHSVTVGGEANSVTGSFSTVVGGRVNNAGGSNAVAIGGTGNGAGADLSTAVGGQFNSIQPGSTRSMVVGGSYGQIGAPEADIFARDAMILNGFHTITSADMATSVGGPTPALGSALYVQTPNAVWIPTLLTRP